MPAFAGMTEEEGEHQTPGSARGREEVKVTEALFTFVALDENHRPRALPGV